MYQETETPPLNFMEYGMRKFVYDSWNSVMDATRIPCVIFRTPTFRHMILQVLAWMWCIVFSFYVGSFWVMGVSMVGHALLLGNCGYGCNL